MVSKNERINKHLNKIANDDKLIDRAYEARLRTRHRNQIHIIQCNYMCRCEIEIK